MGPGLLRHDQHRASTCSSPRCCGTCPTDRPYDFSKELFPLLLEMGRPIYGYVCEGYWQDIGNLDQYRQANFDALDERVRLDDPRASGCAATSGSARASRSTTSSSVEGPAFIGNYCRIAPDATRRRRTRCSAPASTLRERARVDALASSTPARYIGRSAIVEGAIVGRTCDVRAHVRVHEGVAIGDEVTLGAESGDLPGRPDLPVQGGRVRRAAPREPDLGVARRDRASSAATASPGSSTSTSRRRSAVRLGAALGTALKRGARVVASRESRARPAG